MDKELNEELNVKDEDTAPSFWDRLPYHLVVQVYSYLKESDRVAMAQVCQAWYKSFKNPSLWRSREFYLNETNGEKMILFASTFGHCLTNVEIVCTERTAQSEPLIKKTFESVMEKLQNARLCRLELFDTETNVFHRTNKFKETVTSSLVKLLKSQTALKDVALNNLLLYNKHGTEVLKVLQESSGQTLESLQLIGFFQSLARFFEDDLLKFELLKTDIEKFTNLKEIAMNFMCINEDIIKHWTTDPKLKLECITLHVIDNEQPFEEPEKYLHKISSTTWRNLTEAFPKIAVNLFIYCLYRKIDLIEILTPGMPLNLLYMVTKMEKEQDLELASIMKHLADNFDKKLLSYKIVLPGLEDSIGKEVLLAFKKFRKLTAVRVPTNAAIGVYTIIFKNFEDNQLRKVQFLKRHDEGSSSLHPSQDVMKTFNDLLKNIPNLTVEWADDV